MGEDTELYRQSAVLAASQGESGKYRPAGSYWTAEQVSMKVYGREEKLDGIILEHPEEDESEFIPQGKVGDFVNDNIQVREPEKVGKAGPYVFLAKRAAVADKGSW